MADLTDLASVKTYLKITDTDSDTVLSALISSCSVWFEGQLGRPVLQTTYTSEPYCGDGGRRLALKRWPVTAVSQIQVNGTVIDPAPGPGQDGWSLVGGAVYLHGAGNVFTEGYNNVQVTYTAGYPAVPADIKQAVNDMVGRAFRDRGHQGQASMSIDGQSVSWSPYAASLYTQGVIDSYGDIS